MTVVSAGYKRMANFKDSIEKLIFLHVSCCTRMLPRDRVHTLAAKCSWIAYTLGFLACNSTVTALGIPVCSSFAGLLAVSSIARLQTLLPLAP
jgi:hypothetical protein